MRCSAADAFVKINPNNSLDLKTIPGMASGIVYGGGDEELYKNCCDKLAWDMGRGLFGRTDVDKRNFFSRT